MAANPFAVPKLPPLKAMAPMSLKQPVSRVTQKPQKLTIKPQRTTMKNPKFDSGLVKTKTGN